MVVEKQASRINQRWTKQVTWMRKNTQWRPIVVRTIGTPRLRRENDVRAYLLKMKIQNWSQMAVDREAWNRNVDIFVKCNWVDTRWQ
jgi:hypothetical protein